MEDLILCSENQSFDFSLLLKSAFMLLCAIAPPLPLEGDKIANRQILHASTTLLWLQRDLVRSGVT